MQGYLISVLGKAQMFFGRHFLMAAAGSKNVSQSDANNVLETAGEVTAEATEEVNRFIEFFHDNIPNLISFGVKVVLALIFFFIGSKVIKWIRKVIRKSFERSNVDAGVKQFVDSMIKFSLYVILIFMIATNFGVESSSVAALIASAGVAIGLAVQGSLSYFNTCFKTFYRRRLYYRDTGKYRRNCKRDTDLLYKAGDDRQPDGSCSEQYTDK